MPAAGLTAILLACEKFFIVKALVLKLLNTWEEAFLKF